MCSDKCIHFNDVYRECHKVDPANHPLRDIERCETIQNSFHERIVRQVEALNFERFPGEEVWPKSLFLIWVYWSKVIENVPKTSKKTLKNVGFEDITKVRSQKKVIPFKTITSLVQLKSNWYKKVFRYHFCKLQTLLLMYYDRLPADPLSLTLSKSQIKELLSLCNFNIFEHKCPNGNSITADDLCNNANDCYEGEDEAQCSTECISVSSRDREFFVTKKKN